MLRNYHIIADKHSNLTTWTPNHNSKSIFQILYSQFQTVSNMTYMSGVAQFMEITPGAAADYPRWTMGVFPSVAPSALSPGHWTHKHQPGILLSYPGRHRWRWQYDSNIEEASYYPETLLSMILLMRLTFQYLFEIQFVCMNVSVAQSRLSSCSASHITSQHDNGSEQWNVTRPSQLSCVRHKSQVSGHLVVTLLGVPFISNVESHPYKLVTSSEHSPNTGCNSTIPK